MSLVVCLVGCTTTGPVIGPFSSMTSKSINKKRLQSRIAHANAPVEKKQEAFRAMRLNRSPEEVAVGLGIDPVASSKLSWKEIGKQFFAVLADGAMYTGLGFGIKAIADSGNDGDSGSTDSKRKTDAPGANNNTAGGDMHIQITNINDSPNPSSNGDGAQGTSNQDAVP